MFNFLLTLVVALALAVLVALAPRGRKAGGGVVRERRLMSTVHRRTLATPSFIISADNMKLAFTRLSYDGSFG